MDGGGDAAVIYTRGRSMPDLLARESPMALRVGTDERLARAELRRQIGRLERELSSLLAEGFGRVAIEHRVGAVAAEPRVLDLGALERLRDELAERVADARLTLREQEQVESGSRELLRRMLAAPADYKWVRVSRDDLGLPGCGHWHSRPRLGPIGMLMGWWRVKVSSGCPLAGRLAAVEREAQGRQVRLEAEAGGPGLGPRPTSPGPLGEISPRRAGHPRRDRRPPDRPVRR
jgi:hypothetical protein